MAVQQMTRSIFEAPDDGAIYHETIVMTAGTYSDTYALPYGEVYAIACELTGSGSLEFSIDPPDVLENGSPTFAVWDGVSQINPAVTGFRVGWSSGTVTAKVTVRTAEA